MQKQLNISCSSLSFLPLSLFCALETLVFADISLTETLFHIRTDFVSYFFRQIYVGGFSKAFFRRLRMGTMIDMTASKTKKHRAEYYTQKPNASVECCTTTSTRRLLGV